MTGARHRPWPNRTGRPLLKRRRGGGWHVRCQAPDQSQARQVLVAEVAAAREDHRRAGRVRRLHDLSVALRAARLDDRGDTLG